MGATLEALHNLQTTQRKLSALQSKIESKERTARTHQKKAALLEQEIARKKEEIKQQQLAMARLELDIKSREAEIAKHREALNRSKTNKEYAALLTQINLSKADTTKLEDQLLEMMGRLEQYRTQESEFRVLKDREQELLETHTKEVDKFKEGTRAELEMLEAQRVEVASKVPASALQVFERTSERHDGEAMALVVQPHPKRQELMCEGCNMSVTLEQYVSLQGRDEVQLCNSCGRILYVEK